MKILSITLGRSRTLPGKSTRTGFFKEPVAGPVLVDRDGLVGDAVLNRKHHGGPDQALYLEGSVTLDWWRQTLGLPLPPGSFGENLVIEGLDNRDLAVGDRLECADVVLEITAPRTPCATFAAAMDRPAIVREYWKAARPGAYARVVSGGYLTLGAVVTHAAFAGDRPPLADLMLPPGKRLDAVERARLLALPLASRWRQKLGAKG
ncbi:MOSC domain-containing protein [Rhizobium paknamense]|uniref:MOSC domain-containing protein YiiM n=1 Tax=Rhizobium paknamense TaxID=1206817 RepID=A0ABU0IJD4_9HYPH|nr:MOSC domain-containing protein [Rhizobium paknamense]MDQ0458370.1 MOSC domain-containing protein YiiM [Rhizobium paknamense]